jgi:hypothetical protein
MVVKKHLCSIRRNNQGTPGEMSREAFPLKTIRTTVDELDHLLSELDL